MLRLPYKKKEVTIMSNQTINIQEARETINHLIQGVDPYTGEVLDEIGFLQNPKMIRCFALMSDVLTQAVEEGQQNYNKKDFEITLEQVEKIKCPKGDIGVMSLVKAINDAINKDHYKQLSAFGLNRKLKEVGVLAQSTEPDNKQTVITELSAECGITTIKSTFNQETYDKIVYMDLGKDYVLDHLVEWFGAKDEDVL
jgi:hypothetical protein